MPPEKPSIERQIACVRRELGYRERVYAGLVARGKMPEKTKVDEIAAMKAVLETLEFVRDSREPKLGI